MAKKNSTPSNGETKPKKPRGARKAFSATIREKTEKRLASLLKQQAKQRSMETEIAECRKILSTLGGTEAPVDRAFVAAIRYDEDDSNEASDIE